MNNIFSGKVIGGIVVGVMIGLLSFAVPAFSGQNIWAYVAKNYITGGAALLNQDTTGSLIVSGGTTALNAVSGVAVVVKTGTGRISSVNVISASGVGAIYDSNTVASGVAANQIFAIPATVGTYELDWPVASGIILNPSSSVISVKYQ